MWITLSFNGGDDPLNQWLNAHCNNTYKKIEHGYEQKGTSITSSTSSTDLTFSSTKILKRKNFLHKLYEMYYYDLNMLYCRSYRSHEQKMIILKLLSTYLLDKKYKNVNVFYISCVVFSRQCLMKCDFQSV